MTFARALPKIQAGQIIKRENLNHPTEPRRIKMLMGPDGIARTAVYNPHHGWRSAPITAADLSSDNWEIDRSKFL